MSDSPAKTESAAPRGSGRWNLWLGVGVLVFALLSLTVWFPRDIGSGFLQKNLIGHSVPGDAFFPVLLILLMAILAVCLIVSQWRGKGRKGGEVVGRIGLDNLGFLLRAALLTAVGILAMNWAGPVLVWLTNAAGLTEVSGYRAVSARFPFDVSGFFVGATLLTCGFIHTTRHRLTLRDVVIAICASAVLILIFDQVLDNIQLPPNSDL